MCAPLTRRQFLRLGALAAATPLAARAYRPVRAFGAAAARTVPINLELVTLTETSAVLTWLTADVERLDRYDRPHPVPADTVVELGTSPTNLRRVVERDDETPFHYVELDDLEPGRPYFYRCSSNGLMATPTQFVPEPPATGSFTTPLPPGGPLLFTMAWINDLHVGELVSGLAYSDPALPGGGVPPGYAVDPANPYWRVMARAAVSEARSRGAHLLLVNGDLTSDAEPAQMDEVKHLFDTFGTYRKDYFVTRGNHDTEHAGRAWSTCQASNGGDDCLREYFFGNRPTYFSFDHKGVHFVGLDTVDQRTGQGSVPAVELEWLRADLKRHAGMPTFVFGHHPVSDQARLTTIGGPGFSLSPTDGLALESALAGSSVVGVYSGHTHRNNRTSSAIAPNIPFIELGAVKEYPGGYGLVRVFAGGYTVNFYKTRSPAARAWSEQSRGEYLGLYPWYTLGRLSDRNFTVSADFTDAARPALTNPRRDGDR